MRIHEEFRLRLPLQVYSYTYPDTGLVCKVKSATLRSARERLATKLIYNYNIPYGDALAMTYGKVVWEGIV